jgi:hypothetical protein
MEKWLVISAVLVVMAIALFGPRDTGCCQLGADRCASGQGVTREECVHELDGEFCPDETCNIATGQCE